MVDMPQYENPVKQDAFDRVEIGSLKKGVNLEKERTAHFILLFIVIAKKTPAFYSRVIW